MWIPEKHPAPTWSRMARYDVRIITPEGDDTGYVFNSYSTLRDVFNAIDSFPEFFEVVQIIESKVMQRKDGYQSGLAPEDHGARFDLDRTGAPKQ